MGFHLSSQHFILFDFGEVLQQQLSQCLKVLYSLEALALSYSLPELPSTTDNGYTDLCAGGK